jgi:hypothetical protein
MKNYKPYLAKLTGFVSTPKMWNGFNEMLDSTIELHQKKLEQSVDPVDLYKAQGAIQVLRQLKYLRDEVNASQKAN